jgi:two-component sensor histidine kinase
VEVTVNYLKYRDYEFSCSFSQDITERKLAEERIRASLKEKEVLLKEIHHRVKNNLQIVSSLLEFQADSISDPQSRNFFHECQGRINSMALIHEKLYQTRDFACIDLGEYLEHLARHLLRSYAADNTSISLKMAVGKVPLGIDEAIPCGLIANELVSNALKYAFPAGGTGEIVVRCDADSDGWVTMSIADNGVGLPAGLDFSRTETLGYQLVVMLTKQLRGTVEVRSDHGVAVTVRFSAKEGR